MEAAQVYHSGVKGTRLRQLLDSWGPCSLPYIQTFQEHVMSYLGALDRDDSVFSKVWRLSYTCFTEMSRWRVANWNVNEIAQGGRAMTVGWWRKTLVTRRHGWHVLAWCILERGWWLWIIILRWCRPAGMVRKHWIRGMLSILGLWVWRSSRHTLYTSVMYQGHGWEESSLLDKSFIVQCTRCN